MSEVKRDFKVYLLGDEPDLIKAASDYFASKASPSITYSFTSCPPLECGGLEDLLREGNTFLVYVDFTNPDIDEGKLVRQLNFVKRHHLHRQVVFVGLFKDKEALASRANLLHFGFSYFYVKGNDLSQLFDDTFYVAFDDNPGFPSFARAQGFMLPYEAALPGLIIGMNAEAIGINVDLGPDQENWKLKHHFLGSSRTDEFPLEASFANPGPGDALVRSQLAFPYPGPWEEVEPQMLLRDTVETFLGHYEAFVPKKFDCLIATQDDAVYIDLLSLGYLDTVSLHLEQSSLVSRIPQLRPDLILIDGVPTSEGDELGELRKVIQEVQGVEDYSPSIIVFKTSISSDELKGTLRYPKILGHRMKMDRKTLELLMEKYGKKEVEVSEDNYFFRPLDTNSSVDIKLDLKITGISEHAITFFSPLEIPMYANLKFDIPVECYLLIVPPTRELPHRPDGTHYMGFIHGHDQQEAAYLRKFVNQIIFEPLKKFEKIAIKTTEKEISPEALKAPPQADTIKKEHSFSRPNRRSFNKSKL